jgi:hypothetical protein
LAWDPWRTLVVETDQLTTDQVVETVKSLAGPMLT